VQRSGDERGDCLIGCPRRGFTFSESMIYSVFKLWLFPKKSYSSTNKYNRFLGYKANRFRVMPKDFSRQPWVLKQVNAFQAPPYLTAPSPNTWIGSATASTSRGVSTKQLNVRPCLSNIWKCGICKERYLAMSDFLEWQEPSMRGFFFELITCSMDSDVEYWADSFYCWGDLCIAWLGIHGLWPCPLIIFF